MLNVVIAEAALELVPPGIAKHPSVRNEARRRQVEPSEMLLDRSIHHFAMSKLDDAEKRGRPDLVHLTLLSVTSTPLYQRGEARVYIHTRNDVVLELKEKTRPPKSYARFRDLVEDLLVKRPDSGLISVYDGTVPELIRRIGADLVVGLSTQGKMSTMEEVAVELLRSPKPAVFIGGFPRGHFTPETISWLHLVLRIHPESLDAHVVAARLIYEVERIMEVAARANEDAQC